MVSGLEEVTQLSVSSASQREPKSPAFRSIKGVLDPARTAFLLGARCTDPGEIVSSVTPPGAAAALSHGKLEASRSNDRGRQNKHQLVRLPQPGDRRRDGRRPLSVKDE